MSKDSKDERTAFILKNVAVGSLILATSFAARQILKDLLGPHDHNRPR